MAEKEAKWMSYLGKAVDAFLEDVKGSVPDELKKHLKTSIKEMLLAARTVIDKGVEKLDTTEKLETKEEK